MVVSGWNRARVRFSSQDTSPPMRGLLSARRVLVQSSSCSVRWDVLMELMKEEPARARSLALTSTPGVRARSSKAGWGCLLDVQLPQVKTAVQDYASTRGVSVQVATNISWQRSSWRKPFRMVLSPAGKAWTRCHDACVPWCYL